MAENRRSAAKSSARNNTSLLLQPTASGFTLNQMASNTLLMPISQPTVEAPEKDSAAEIDSFVGQELQNTETPSPCSFFQSNQPIQESFPVSSAASFNNPAMPNNTFMPISQDLQFSAPDINASYGSASPLTSYQPVTNVSPSVPMFQPSTMPMAVVPNIDSSSASMPPKGPVNSFRRKSGGVSYVPPPNLQASHSSTPSPVLNSSPVQNVPAQHMYAPSDPVATQLPVAPPTGYQAQAPQQQQQTSPPLNVINPHVLHNLYRPVTQHWFYCKIIETKHVWIPFSILDSLSLEEAFMTGIECVPTDGGRYDVTLSDHKRRSVYWEEESTIVRRCSWFFKGEGERFVPYEESHSQILEEAYKQAVTSNFWPKIVNIGDSVVTIHNPNVIAHTQTLKHQDAWGGISDIKVHPRVVRRGIDEFDNIDDGEPTQIDHIVFVVHGIGPVCDLRFRDLIECVDDFRAISLMLMQSHFSTALSDGKVGRVEFLPVKWHQTLHGESTGIDKQMKPITLSSIPKLRSFANDTILDVLYYTSPIYCQTIIDTVCQEINRLFKLFLSRNPHFSGQKSVIGHSLGSLILFDLLANQTDTMSLKSGRHDNQSTNVNSIADLLQSLNLTEYSRLFQNEAVDLEVLKTCSETDLKDMNVPLGPRKKILVTLKSLQTQPNSNTNITADTTDSAVTSVSYSMSPNGTGHLAISYPKLDFSPSCFFAMGSPVPMFLTVRGQQTDYNQSFQFPTCPQFFNIFHPYDPVAYRFEPIINPSISTDPVLVPHHKGRKRLHLELKDSLTKYGTDIKQKVIDSIKNTWNTVYEFARSHKTEELDEQIEKVVEEEIKKQEQEDAQNKSDYDQNIVDVDMGMLNGGRRIDYVLQEAPFESINQYLFALASHTCYWESEDTVLFILKELYALNNIQPNTSIRQEPKLQLYNPAAMPTSSSAAPPPNYMPSPFSHQPVQDQSAFAAPGCNQAQFIGQSVPSISGPPPLSGFMRNEHF